MGKPGSGRYTTYVPVKSDKTQMLSKLFKGGMEGLYGDKDSNADAAAVASANAVKVIDGSGDPDMFGKGVDLSYGAAPDTKEVKWNVAGDPANPYVPDLSSPGPGRTEGTQKDKDPSIKSVDIKPSFDPANPTVNTQTPSATSTKVGTLPIGVDLVGGKSSV